MDTISRTWVDTPVLIGETATQVTVIFESALEVEGLLGLLTDDHAELGPDDRAGRSRLQYQATAAPMTAERTLAFITLMAAQHHVRPGLPHRSATIESLFGRIKAEWLNLATMQSPHCSKPNGASTN